MDDVPAVLDNAFPWAVAQGHVLDVLRGWPDGRVHCCATSPPFYGLRRYLPEGHPDLALELGAERLPCCFGWVNGVNCAEADWREGCYACKLVLIFRELRRVLHPSGTLWLNLGDSFLSGKGTPGGRRRWKEGVNGDPKQDARRFGERATDRKIPGLKSKDLILVPECVALALRADGWYLRQRVVWWKQSPVPEPVQDRPTCAMEMIFLLSRGPRYYYDKYAALRPPAPSSGERYRYAFSSAANAVLAADGLTTCRPLGFREQPDGCNQWNVWPDMPDDEGDPVGDDPMPLWSVPPQPGREGHKAMWPPSVPSRCFRLGSSEHGCCASCGAPWVRVLRRARDGRPRSDGPARPTAPGYFDQAKVKVTREGGGTSMPRDAVTTEGWRPSCGCGAGAAPCVTADVFCGSGRSGVAARRLGRRFLGVELNDDFARSSRARVARAAPLMDSLSSEIPSTAGAPRQADLFG